MRLLKLSKYLVSLTGIMAVIWLFPLSNYVAGNGLAQAAVIEGKFDTQTGSEVISGDFISNALPAGNTPAIDGQIQSFLQANGFQYTPLGWSFSGESRECQNGIVFGNLYVTSDPRLTAIWGVDTIIFIPAGLRCGTGLGDTIFGVGEAIIIVYIGPLVPARYFAPVDVIMWSGANDAIFSGLNGMLLRIDPVQ